MKNDTGRSDNMRILYFSTVNWRWIKQRPHFISYYFSLLGHDVDYISLTPLGKTKIVKLKQNRLNILDTYVLPFANRFKFIRIINQILIKSRLRKKKYDIVILTNPMHYLYLPNSFFEECVVIYECMDNVPFFYEGKFRGILQQEEKRTLGMVDGIVVSSKKLEEEMKSRLPAQRKLLPIVRIHNALDKDSMTKKPIKVKLKEPNLVYIGTIGKWMDWDVIRTFARANPEYTIYLIGPLEVRLNEELETNIVLTGSIEHGEVANYIFSGNVMLLPFIRSELTESVDPVKMYEYLSYNRPVISSYWPELDRFADKRVYFYQTYQEFEKLAHSLVNESGGNFQLDQDFIETHNWHLRVKQYDDFLREMLQTLNNKG